LTLTFELDVGKERLTTKQNI